VKHRATIAVRIKEVAGAAGEISREIESAKRCPNCVGTVLGVRGCPKSTLPKSTKYPEILVSAAGFEPATHALKA